MESKAEQNTNSRDVEKLYYELVEAVKDYLKHPSTDGSPLRKDKRTLLARLLTDIEEGKNDN